MTTLSVASILAESATRDPDKIAVVQGSTRLTYDQLWRQARGVAGTLVARGIRPGDRVGLVGPNVTDFVAGYYGILAAGAVVVPVPTLLGPREAAFILGKAQVRLVLTHQATQPLAQGAADQIGAECVPIDQLTDHEPLPRFLTRSADDIAVIFFTSGTTGLPKGAMITHLNVVMNVLAASYDSSRFTADDRIMGCLPLFHIYGQQSAMNTTLRLGATLVLQPRFDAPALLQLMREQQVDALLAVPTMYIQLLGAAKAPGAGPAPQLRLCISGGSPLPVPVLEEFNERFGTEIYEGYGLSETSPTIAVNQARFGVRKGTVGHPVWGNEIEIVDETVPDRLVFKERGERGEIVVRGPAVFAGYLDDEEATAQAVDDGWFRTGDIGIRDADGYLSIVDRTKDLIIRGGYNVYPREVEEVFARHPDVESVAVVGVPDPERGEEICAFVTLRPQASAGVEELLAYGREHLAKHKYPRRIEIIEDMPRGPSMKILKRELRKMAHDAHDSPARTETP